MESQSCVRSPAWIGFARHWTWAVGVAHCGSFVMGTEQQLALAEQVAGLARSLKLETALIGASALAYYGYVRATSDIDFAIVTNPYESLPRLAEAAEAVGLSARVIQPEHDDPLGGTVRFWEQVDADGDPIDPIDVVNFFNPHTPLKIQKAARLAIEQAQPIAETTNLRCVPLPYLIVLKLYAGTRQDLADVVAVIAASLDANLDEIRAVCKEHGLEGEGANSINNLIDEAAALRRQPKR